MTRRDISRSLGRFWPLSLVVFGLFIALGAAASFLPQKKYQADALLYAQPTSIQALSQGATLIPLIAPAIVQQVETPLFQREVAAVAPAATNATLTATNVAGTPVITVSAEATNPHTAASVANAAANELRLRPISSVIKLTVLNPAAAPTSPSSPMKIPILLGCGVLGLILSVSAALIADAMRKRVAGAEMIRKEFGLTVLGEITRSRHVTKPPVELFSDRGSIATSEEYQRLRTNFELLGGDSRTVAITSWGEGEGKTTVTAALGWTIASLGRKVTILDLDLRRPSVHMRFGLDRFNGIVDVMTTRQRGGSLPAAKPTELPGLKVITAGAQVEDPAKVIERVLPTVIRASADRLLLIDTPPLFAAETALVASMVDALVIVIDVRRREPAEVEAMLQVLKLTQTPILGVVLNRVRRAEIQRRMPGYYYVAPESTARSVR